MSSTGRHAGSDQSRSRGRLAVVGVVVTGTVIGGGAFAFTRASSAEPPCPRPVRVAVSPDLAPVVTSVAERLAGARCSAFRVRSQDPASVAAGLRAGNDDTVDVWVPDSSVWLQRVGRSDDSAGSVAHSPVVLAAAPSLGGQVTPDGSSSGFAAVAPGDGRRPVRLSLVAARDSARTSAALVGLQSALVARPDGRRVLAGLLQSAVVRTGKEDVASPLDVATGDAVPASEQQVFTANRAQAAPRLLALYATGPGSVLDFPFAVLSRSVTRNGDAEPLLAALRSRDGRAAVRAAGFRDGSGRPGGALGDTLGVAASRTGTAAPLRAADAAAAMTALSAVRQPSNVLAVLDVSGSMATPVPGTRSTRMDLVLRAAARGLALYPDRNSVGLWTFSTRQTGSLDYRRLVPSSVLGHAGDPRGGRARLGRALAGIRPTHGNTGLYDTMLAAVRSQQRSWQPGHINAVLLLTDGRNHDPQGIDLEQLLRTLRSEQDPARPVPVISVAYGSNTGAETALRQVSAVTGGATYTARPEEIDQVILDALGQRSCRPLCSSEPLR